VADQDLKAKTRIFVPKSALLMGVMDEVGVLQSGEVFLAINPAPGTQSLPSIITVDVIIAKNPCFHPGDVRKLKVCRTLCMPPRDVIAWNLVSPNLLL
jgi:RNA-dependent RNA polymerase